MTAAWLWAAASAAAPPLPGPTTAMPAAEQHYIGIVDRARDAFRAGKSDDARTQARLSLQIDVHAFMGLTHRARDWVGSYMGATISENGYRSFAISIAPGVVIATWDNIYLDARDHTMVRPAGRMARVLEGLTIGQPVRFSAELIGAVVGSDDDMVLRPRIIATITSLKSDDGQPAR